MKRLMTCSVLGLVLVFGALGCAKESDTPQATQTPAATNAPASGQAVQTAFEPGTIKVGDKAVCVICNVKEGSTAPEEVKATVDYQGKTYAFCNEAEKAEFISNAAKYAQPGG